MKNKDVTVLKRIWLLFSITAVIISVIVLYGSVNTKTVVVNGMPVKEEDLIISVETTGTVEENGMDEIFVPADDVATNILVKEGQKVEKNDIVANLYSGNVLKSPAEGYVKLINPSNNLSGASNIPLIVLSNNSSLILKLTVDERDIYKINIGNDVNITCVAVPGKTYLGRVTEISSFAKQLSSIKDSSAVVDVTIEFVGDTQGIRSGYTAIANIIGIKNEKAITVPFDAIIRNNNESYVWLAKNNTVVMQKVETGLETDFETQILSGLEKGDVVILNPSWNSNSKIIIK